MHSFRSCGLSIASTLDLPGASAVDPVAQPDVVITPGTLPTILEHPVVQGPNWTLAADRFLVTIPGIVTLLIRDGKAIDYEIEPGASSVDVAAFVIGMGIGILLQQRGHLTLSASAIQVGKAAALFCGPPALGKSTLAAAFVARGYPLIADEIAAIRLAEGMPPCVHPERQGLRLWPDSIRQVGLSDQPAVPLRPGVGKRSISSSAAVRPLPVSAMYVLDESGRYESADIKPANVAQAAGLVRRSAYRPALIAPMRQEALYLEGAVALHRHGSIVELEYRQCYEALPALVRELESRWAATDQQDGY